jgi:hypothetical protein
MSFKVWVAYRLKNPRDLWPFVSDVRAKATKRVVNVFAMQLVMTAFDLDEKEHANRLEYYEDPWAGKVSVARDLLRKRYQAATASPYRDIDNYDVSLVFRSHKGEVYMIPFGDMLVRDALSFLKRDPRVADFHYQNQVDKPRHISNAEWGRRRDIWNVLCEPQRWNDALTLEIMSFSMFPYVIPEAVRLAGRRGPDWIKSKGERP